MLNTWRRRIFNNQNIGTGYKLQTAILVIYIAVTPLLFSYNPQKFHDFKLITIYSSITLLFLISIIFNKQFKDNYKFLIKIFQTEFRLILVAIFIMNISLLINFENLSNLLSSAFLASNIFKGAGPNYLSFPFYLFSFLFIGTSIVSIKKTNNTFIGQAITLSLVIVGIVILYQIFVYDFLDRGQKYLFGWGNSNYTPDPFSIVGLMLIVPLIYNQKINYFHLGLGVFFFEMVLLSSSRAAYVSLFFTLFITSIILVKTKKVNFIKILKFYGYAIVTVIISYLLFHKLGFEKDLTDFENLDSVINRNGLNYPSMYSRFDLWIVSIRMYIASPTSLFFGIGQSVFIWNSDTTNYLVTNAHNQYLGVLLSAGIIVFVIFIVLLIKQYIYVIKLTKHNVDNIVLLSGLIFISIKWMFNSLNAIHSPFVFLVFVLISYRYMEMKRNEIVNQS